MPVGAARVSRNSLGSVIPDGAVHRWKFNNSLTDDIGSADGTMNGNLSYVSGSYERDTALTGDGSGYVETTTLGSYGSGLDQGYAIAFTLEYSGSESYFMGTGDLGPSSFFVGEGAKWDTTNTTDVLQFSFQDGSGARTYNGSTVINDGTKRRILINATGLATDDVTFYIDTVSESPSLDRNDMTPSAQDLGGAFYLFAINDGGSAANQTTATLDDVVLYGDSLSSSEIQQDYDMQPWT